MMRNTLQSYGWLAIGLHWLMAVMIFALFGLGLWMVELNYDDSWYHDAPYLHKAIGMLLLFLFIFRLLWRLINVRPELMGVAWEKTVALGVHRLHYVLLLIVTLSGYLIPTALNVGIDMFGWFSLPALMTFSKTQADLAGLVHGYAAWAVIGLAAAHSVAALKHHMIDRDITLLRMLGIHSGR